jgi:hypothetical protein
MPAHDIGPDHDGFSRREDAGVSAQTRHVLTAALLQFFAHAFGEAKDGGG